jgi:hypothetical protein
MRVDSLTGMTVSSTCLDPDKFICCVDIPGHQTPAGVTLPPNVAVSTLKPDSVAVDRPEKNS